MPSNLVAISKMLCVANSAISEDQENSICNRFFNLSNKDSVDLLKDFQNFLKKKEEALQTCGALYIIAQLVEGEKSLIEDSQAEDIAKKCNCKFEKIKDYKEIDSIFNKAIRENLSK